MTSSQTPGRLQVEKMFMKASWLLYFNVRAKTHIVAQLGMSTCANWLLLVMKFWTDWSLNKQKIIISASEMWRIFFFPPFYVTVD